MTADVVSSSSGGEPSIDDNMTDLLPKHNSVDLRRKHTPPKKHEERKYETRTLLCHKYESRINLGI